MNSLPDPIYLIAILIFLGLAPFVAMMVTSYVKIVVVMSLIRNALGIQQIPPNMVINGLSIILTMYIMNPIAKPSTVPMIAAIFPLFDLFPSSATESALSILTLVLNES